MSGPDPAQPTIELHDRLAIAIAQVAANRARIEELQQWTTQVLTEAEAARRTSMEALRQRRSSPAGRDLMQQSEHARLLARLETMPVIEQAKGIIMAQPDRDGPVRAQLSALRSVLILSMLLTRQDDQASILGLVANAVGSLGPCRTEGIFLDGRWQPVQVPAREAGPVSLPGVLPTADGHPAAAGGALVLGGVAWSWAYSLAGPHGPAGYLVVGAEGRPTESERFLLRVLAQQTGVVLANARLHQRERERAAELLAAHQALLRSVEIHDRLSRVAADGEGQQGIARAVYELTDLPAAIEDRFGNLHAWAGPDRPEPYPRDRADQRSRLLDRAMSAGGPVSEGERLVSVAVVGGVPVGVLVVRDRDRSAGDAERMVIEHATTVLAMELARRQSLAQSDVRLRTSLVLDLVGGAGRATLVNRAQALGYDLGRPHRVVLVHAPGGDDETGAFFEAVGRAARAAQVGSLLAPRRHDVIVLADNEVSWDGFLASIVTERHGGRCRIGVGGRCQAAEEFPHSCREAELALRIQRASGGPEQATIFDDLGVYKVLASAHDTAAMDRFVQAWLGELMAYDAAHGTDLVLTLSEYLDRGGSYQASAQALTVHRSTLKYRLRRIREVSGRDLGLPDVQFNLHVATRAWRTLRVLRET